VKAPHAQVLFISETVLLGLSAILFLLGIYLSFNRYVGNLPNYLVAISIFFCAVAVIGTAPMNWGSISAPAGLA